MGKQSISVITVEKNGVKLVFNVYKDKTNNTLNAVSDSINISIPCPPTKATYLTSQYMQEELERQGYSFKESSTVM
jgi:hypothetical protein